jgi:hypothetical protein
MGVIVGGMPGMIDRRFFLKLTGLTGLAAASGVLPMRLAYAAESLQEPGLYQITGTVRLVEPQVMISGITNAQQISWTPGSLSTPVASFTSFEQFDRPWQMPEIRVSGGTLEAVKVTPIVFG